MTNQSQELVEFVFSLKKLNSEKFEVMDKTISFVDFIVDDVLSKSDFECMIHQIVSWIKFEDNISILFEAIDQEDMFYDVEVLFDKNGNPISAEISNSDYEKTINFGEDNG